MTLGSWHTNIQLGSSWYLSYFLSCEPNKGCMKKLHPWEFDIPTYHFGVHKIISGYSSWVMFRVHKSKIKVGALFMILQLGEKFLMVSQATQMKIVYTSYTPRKMTYKIITSRFRKLLVFHSLGWYLGYIIY